MRRIAAVLALAAGAGVGCAVLALAQDEPQAEEDPVADARPLIVVHGRDASRPGDPIPIEGSIEFLRIRGLDLYAIFDARFTNPVYDLSHPTSPGRYRVTAFTRTCAGTCAYLDRPSGRCARRFRLRKDEVVTVSITARRAHRCKIALTHGR